MLCVWAVGVQVKRLPSAALSCRSQLAITEGYRVGRQYAIVGAFQRYLLGGFVAVDVTVKGTS
jgi:hypothetical protein